MKLYIKSIIAFAALLLTTNAWAGKEFTYIQQLNGTNCKQGEDAGTVSGVINGTTATLTVTPNEGNYFENTDGSITVRKTLNGQYAQAREKAPGYDTPVALTVSGTPNLTGNTVFTFEVTDDNYDYEVTVNFKSRISIAGATITPAQTSYTYTGETIEPSVTTVKLTDGTPLASTDYTIAYENNINVPATANDPQPTISVTGAGKYTGTASTTFTINKADPVLTFSPTTATITFGNESAFVKPTLTTTPNGLTVTYQSMTPALATVDETTGDITPIAVGENIEIKATFAGNANYNSKSVSYTLTVAKGTATVSNAPTAKENLTYTGKALALINAGECTTGNMQYKVGADGTYSTDIPTGTDAKTYNIYYKDAGNNNYNESAEEGPITVTIGRAAGTISFDKGSIGKTLDDDPFTNELTNTGDGTVSYDSDDKNVANVDTTTGEVTIAGIGNATITATVTEKIDGNYSYATPTITYTITVSRAKGTGYALWVGDTQVTAENADDILKDATTGETNKSGSFVFNPKNNYLFINYEGKDGEEDLTIESRLPKLVIYIRNEVGNKLKRIYYNNIDDAEGTKPGKLVFTTYYNAKPGKLFLTNGEGESAIWGFSSVNFESELAVIEPDGVYYNNQQLEWTKDVEGVEVICPANEVTIARPLETTKKVTVKLSDYVQRNDEGEPMKNEDDSPKIVSLRNTIINNLLHVLAKSDDPDSDEGFDNSDGVDGITVEGLMTDKKVGTIAGRVLNSDLVPGGNALAEEYNGFIFMPPAGEGTISTTLKVDPGYAFHLAMEKDIQYGKDENDKYIISGDEPFAEVHELSSQNNPARGKVKKIEYKDAGDGYVEVTIDYDSPEPTYCYLYLVKTNDASGARSIVPIGKRDKVHGKVTSINVNIVKKSSGNPPYIASDGVIPNMEDPDDDDDVITGIKVITNTGNNRIDNNKWYNLNGQQMNTPTKQGLYIINGKKIIIK